MTEIVVDEEVQGRPHGSRRRWIAVTTTVIVVLAGGGAVYAERDRIWPAKPTGSGSGVVDNGSPTSLATVTRQDLQSQQQLSGTLGYTGSYTVLNHAQGTLTALPGIGQVIRQGQQLYQVNGAPVILMYGSVPGYRDLTENDTGADVTQLNADLVALGYADTDQIDPTSDFYSWQTKAAVERMQDALGVTQDGVLHLSQVMFLPGAIRVTSVPATLGGQAGGPVLQATSTARQVVVQVDATQQAQIKVGDKVTITLPNNQTTPGTVTTVGTVATAPAQGSNNPATIEVDISPSDPTATGSLDQAPVQVSITTASAPNALVVPVNALLSLTDGGYAVEVVQSTGAHKLVGVTLGLFDDASGLVQVTGALTPGDRVVVAGS
jgi:hypothetical protein